MKNNKSAQTRRKRLSSWYYKREFSDAELRILEREFIESFSTTKNNSLKLVFSFQKRYFWYLFSSMLLYIVATLPHICVPVVTANIINLAIDRPQDFAVKLLINCSIIAALVIINLPSNVIRTKLYSVAVRRIEAGLRGALVRKLQQLSITFHKEMQSGRIQSKLMRDIETIHLLLFYLFTEVPVVLINIITAIVIVVTKSLPVFYFFLLCVPCAVTFTRLFRKPIKNNNTRFREDMESTSASLMSMLEMTEITRAHALENRETNKMTGVINKVANSGFKMDMLHGWFGSGSWAVFQLFSILCLVFSCYLAYTGKIGIGEIPLYQSYFALLSEKVSHFVNLMPAITKGFESVSSIGEVLSSDEIEINSGKARVERLNGKYEFKNLTFSYEDGVALLKGIDLEVNPGETVAFVGESGSGKSTLVNLILGFNFPDSGELLVDGKDITKLNLYSYRKRLAVVPQNTVLFMGSIRENITYGMTEVSDEKLKTVLDAARLTDFVNSLPDGVDTYIEEHGANFSGGQKQRISIARALLRDPDVIIFDEATSALDSVSEKEIQTAINNLSKGKTTFIVAHRLSTIKAADKIAVIKDGVCCEVGSYDELIAQKGVFYEMQKPQMVEQV